MSSFRPILSFSNLRSFSQMENKLPQTMSSTSYNSVEPTVVDEELLKKAVIEQVPLEISESAKKEGIDPLEVHSLRLDYKSSHLVI